MTKLLESEDTRPTWLGMNVRSPSELLELAINACEKVESEDLATIVNAVWYDELASKPRCCVAGAVVLVHFPDKMVEPGAKDLIEFPTWMQAINHLRMGDIVGAVQIRRPDEKDYFLKYLSRRTIDLLEEARLEMLHSDEVFSQFQPKYLRNILQILKDVNL